MIYHKSLFLWLAQRTYRVIPICFDIFRRFRGVFINTCEVTSDFKDALSGSKNHEKGLPRFGTGLLREKGKGDCSNWFKRSYFYFYAKMLYMRTRGV